MPARKTTNSLKRICLTNIASHMEDYWMKGYYEVQRDLGKPIHVIGPFEYLTSDLLQAIIRMLVELKLLKKQHLNVLIDTRLEKLDLNVCKSASNTNGVINLVMTRCYRLTHLNLCMLTQVSARVLSGLVEKLPLLQMLNMRQTKCSDQVLTVIGNSCRDIRDLNVYGCPVTDMGVMSLCVSFDPNSAKCGKLEKLDISSTNVTPKGAQLVLDNLKNMHCLVYYDVIAVLEKAHSETFLPDQVIPANQQYKLQYISEYGTFKTPIVSLIGMQVLVAYCPFLTEFICFNGITNEQMLCLSNLQYLTRLHLADMHQQMTFCEGLLPFLQIRGKQLEELHLFEVNELNVRLIGVCCPVLVNFSCLIAGYPFAKFSTQSHPEVTKNIFHKPFERLQVAKINMYKTENDFPASHLEQLLANCTDLQELILSGNQALTDDLIYQTLRDNGLCKLERVTFELCHKVTGVGVQELLESNNELRMLTLKDCWEITRRDFEKLQQFSDRQNFDLEIAWM